MEVVNLRNIMKPMIIASLFVASNAMALDFDTEWAKFSNDFAKLKSRVNVTVDVPKAGNFSILPSKNTQDNTLEQVDPRSPDRLGHTLSDPLLREHVTSLYKKPDTVVYSATIR
jgi:hypothetical protein